MATVDPRVNDLIKALESAESFSAPSYINRLHDQTLLASSISFLKSASTPLTGNNTGVSDFSINNADHTTLITRLANQSAALALASVPDANDPKKLREDDKADANMQDSLCRLAQACYADHLNSELRRLGHGKLLDDLKNDATFLQAFKARLSDPMEPIRDFYKSEALLHTNYSMHMIFVANYLFNDYETLLCSPDQMWTREFGNLMGKILAFHLEEINADDDHTVRGAVKSAAVNLVVKNENGKLQPAGVTDACLPFQTPLIEQSALTGESLEKVKNVTLSQTGFSDWASTASIFVELWKGKQGDWQRAIGTTTSEQVSCVQTRDVTGVGLPEAPPVPTTQHEQTTWTGKKVQDWLNSVHKDDDAKDFVSESAKDIKETKTWYERYNITLYTMGYCKAFADFWHLSVAAPPSCFVAGTQIITRSGNRSIELLAENDIVLTRGSSNEWGIVSDEKVVTPMENPVLYGFNGGETFFTAGHVFHTTTGLRAIDPIRATRENPWMQPGRLLIGHTLLWWNAESNQYELVVIDSLHCEQRPDVTEVYGVHLREGLRSYHANGYLVAVNYPEITIKSIARILASLSPKEQTQCLLAFQELRPVLQRFGIEGAGEALRKQLNVHSQGISAQFYDQVPTPRGATRCSQMKRVFELSPNDGDSSHTLPLYEHGLVDLDDHALSGVGVVALTPGYDTPLSEPSTEIINFSVTIASSVNNALDTGAYTGPTIGLGAPLAAAAADAGAVGAEEEVKEDSKEELGDEVKEYFADADRPVWTASAEAFSQSKVANKAIESPSLLKLRANPISQPLKFPMSFDTIPFKKDQKAFKDERPFGSIGMSIFRESPESTPRALIIVDCLDQLLQDINKLSPDRPLDALYDTTLVPGEDHTTKGTVRVLDPEILIKLADDLPEDDSHDGYSRTYKTHLKSDVILPIVFKEMEIDISMDEFTVCGQITEFNPANKNHLGTKHYFATNKAGHLDPFVTGPRRDDAGKIISPLPVSPDAHDLTTKLDTTYLIKMPGYDDNAVHMRSRDYLRDMMYYHMDPELRGDKFLNVPQPSTLPAELSINLEDRYRNWIKDVYAPAYLAYMISETNTNFREKYKFTDKEKARIAYWWTGTGKKCLSSQPEYQAINKLCARHAMLSLHKELQRYINDDGPTWASKLRVGVGQSCVADIIFQSVTSKSNLINLYSNVLYALDPTGTHIQDLYRDVNAEVIRLTMNQPGVLAVRKDWLYDAIAAFVDELFTNKTGMDPDAREALIKDMEDLTGRTRDELMAQGRDKAALQLTTTIHLLTDASQTIHSVSILCTGLRRWGYSTDAVTQKALEGRHTVGLDTKGGKLKAVMTTLALVASIASCMITGVDLSPSEKWQLGTDFARQAIDIISPFLHVKPPVQASAAAMEIEMAVMNNAIQQGAGNIAANPVLMKNGAGAVENVQNGVPKSIAEIGKKRSISLKLLRGLGIALGFAFVAFQCWDLAEHWADMSGLQATFGVLQALCTFVVAVCELLAWVYPTVACFPVVGAIAAVVGLLVTLVIWFWVGDRKPKEPEASSGEKFVENFKNGLLAGWDDPPPALVKYDISRSTDKAGQLCTISVRGTNETGHDLVLVPQEETTREASADASDKWSRLTLSVAAGSDSPCWFSTSTFTYEANQAPNPEKSTEGKAYLETSSAVVGKLLTPNGKRDNLTTYDFAATAPAKPSTGNYAVFKPGESFVISMVGIVNKTGESVLQLIESRPGVLGCVQKHTWKRVE
ncbi:hypothetical protein J3E69DRAFT_368161 [Trichoderma sp. SZMC 28015]